MKHTYSGLSLNELYKKYGTGSAGFYSSDPWWKNEKFADEKPDKGVYEITFDEKSKGLNYTGQVAQLKEGFSPIHPAIVVEAILEHFKKTGERICEDWYVRTSSLGSGGVRVHVGRFGGQGLLVDYAWDVRRNGCLGLSAARKIGALKTGSLETFDPLILKKISEAKKLLEEVESIISKE